MLVPVAKLFQLTKCDFLLAIYPCLGIMVLYRGQKSEVGDQRSEVGDQRSEAGDQKSEVRRHMADDRRQTTEDRGQHV
jgi:hypothetical protein